MLYKYKYFNSNSVTINALNIIQISYLAYHFLSNP